MDEGALAWFGAPSWGLLYGHASDKMLANQVLNPTLSAP